MKYNVCLDIVTKCNDNCLFCFRDKTSEEISYLEKQRILQSIYDSNMVSKVTMTGGGSLTL